MNVFDRWAMCVTRRRLAPHASELGVRAIYLWLLCYASSLATEGRLFWGTQAPPHPRVFDSHFVADWVIRLSLHPRLVSNAWVWPLMLAGVALVGLFVRPRIWLTLLASFLLAQLDALVWFAVDGGNRMIAIQLLFCAAMSLRGDSIAHVTIANVGLSLARAQLLIAYLGAGVAKAVGEPWQRGDALSRVLLHPAWSDGFIAQWLLRHATVSSWLTYLTVVWELAFVVLVLFRKTRPLALGLGVLFHVAIAQVMGLFFFSFAMVACYAFWLDESVVIRAGRSARAMRSRMWFQVKGRGELDRS